MMVDFQINRGLSTELFINGQVNPDLIIEEGCWYLCTDTAELYIGVNTEEGLTLKQVNDAEAHPIVAEVKAQVTSLVPKIEEEIVPTIEEVKSTTDELKAWVENKDFLQHIDLDGYATEEFVNQKIAEAELADKDIDLSAYYTKTEVNALIPNVSEFIKDIPEEYITESELAAKGYLTEHQDLTNYAKTQFVTKTTLAQKFEVLPIEGMLVSYRENEVRLNTQRVAPVHQTVGQTGNPNMYYATFRMYAPEGATGVIESDGSQTDAEPTALSKDVFGRSYATIWSAIASYNGTKWTKWGDSSTVNKYLGFYYTFKWFKEDTLIGTDKVRVILTNDSCHDDLVPDAVARRIDEKIAAIDIPETNLDDYYTKTETTSTITAAVAEKANEVPFETAKFVTNPVGNFKFGDDLKGLTMAELFAKLLGLSDEPGENPDTPDVPSNPTSPAEIITYLMNNKVAMYSQDTQGVLTPTPFASAAWTETEAAVQMDGLSTIYQIKNDSGAIIESGYQEATDYNEEAWLTIALPSIIKNVKVKMYDPDVSDWVDVNFKVVKAEEQTIDGYIIWTVPEEYEIQSGDTYRFVVIE